MRIEVFSDTVCPWCYVGLARLKRALLQRPQRPFELHWLPFELNPDLPAAGEDRGEYMQRRFGDVNRFADAQQQLRQLGTELGLDFRFDLQRRMPNTRRSHVLIGWAAGQGAGAQTRVQTAILQAYFSRGLDIGDGAVLADLAADCGLDRAAAGVALDDAALHSTVVKLENQARQWNISGVPTFIFDRREAFSGAQEESVILEFIDRADA